MGPSVCKSPTRDGTCHISSHRTCNHHGNGLSWSRAREVHTTKRGEIVILSETREHESESVGSARYADQMHATPQQTRAMCSPQSARYTCTFLALAGAISRGGGGQREFQGNSVVDSRLLRLKTARSLIHFPTRAHTRELTEILKSGRGMARAHFESSAKVRSSSGAFCTCTHLIQRCA